MTSSQINHTHTHISSLITRSNRSEIHLFTASPISEPIRIELEQTVLSTAWVDRATTTKRSRKDENSDITTPPSLAALCEGELFVFTPGSDQVQATIAVSSENTHLVSSPLQKDMVWAIGPASIEQVSLASQKVTKTIKVASSGPAVALSVPIAKNSVPLVLAQDDGNLAIVDTTKKRATSVNVGGEGRIRDIVSRGEEVYIVKDHVMVYDVVKQTFDTIDGDFDSVSVVQNGDESAVALISDKETTIWKDGVFATITAHLSNLFSVGEQLLGVWYDGNETQFVPIPWKEGTISITTKKIASNGTASSKNSTISTAPSVVDEDLSVEELIERITDKLDEPEAILETCLANGNSETVKAVVRSLSNEQLSQLFAVLAQSVASDPTSSTALATWLKWTLFINGASLGKQQKQYENLKALEKGLADGMKLMPHLIALSGRLELLRAHEELRGKGGSVGVTNDDGLMVMDGEGEN